MRGDARVVALVAALSLAVACLPDVDEPPDAVDLSGLAADSIPPPEPPNDGARAGVRVSAGALATDSVPVATLQELDELRRVLTIPVAGVTGSELRDSFDELRGSRRHDALDILAPRGTPVLSAAGGRVLRLHTSKAGGLMVYAADSSERFILMYAHLHAYAEGLRADQPLRRGQVIGYVGTTGNAPPNTPHLHFAILRAVDTKRWWKGTPVNPLPLLTSGLQRAPGR